MSTLYAFDRSSQEILVMKLIHFDLNMNTIKQTLTDSKQHKDTGNISNLDMSGGVSQR